MTRFVYCRYYIRPGIPTCLLDDPNFHLDNLGDPTIAPTIAPTGTYGGRGTPSHLRLNLYMITGAFSCKMVLYVVTFEIIYVQNFPLFAPHKYQHIFIFFVISSKFMANLRNGLETPKFLCKTATCWKTR